MVVIPDERLLAASPAELGNLRALPVLAPVRHPGLDSWQRAFDVLTREAAILDRDGAIVAVNAAWKEFAAANVAAAGQTAGLGVGTNYLDVCETAAAGGCDQAEQTAHGLREVLSGARDLYECKYPCHAPFEQRWFRMRAVAFTDGGERFLLVQHENITPLHRAEVQVRRQAQLLDELDAAVICTDLEGIVTVWNRAAERLYGWLGTEAVGRSLAELAPGAAVPSRSWEGNREMVDRYGRRFCCHLRTSPVLDEDGEPVGALSISTALIEPHQAGDRQSSEDPLEAERQRWVATIDDALAHDRFELHAQPIIELATGQTVQHELLLRLRTADGVLLGPDRFLPAAEQHGLIGVIDRWVFSRGIELAAGGMRIHLNLSAQSIEDADLLDTVAALLDATPVPHGAITIELTETAMLSDAAATRAFTERARALGLRFALDDFGTGYNGFANLKWIDADELKIDTQFVRDLLSSGVSERVVNAVISLARSFGISTVAEGVEDAATLERLSELGVDFAQGYHLGRPAPVSAVCATRVTRPEAATR